MSEDEMSFDPTFKRNRFDCKTPNGAGCLVDEPWDHNGHMPARFYNKEVNSPHLPKEYIEEMKGREEKDKKKVLDWVLGKINQDV